jgi:hypothetical protein
MSASDEEDIINTVSLQATFEAFRYIWAVFNLKYFVHSYACFSVRSKTPPEKISFVITDSIHLLIKNY